jgi:hypothetical protein
MRRAPVLFLLLLVALLAFPATAPASTPRSNALGAALARLDVKLVGKKTLSAAQRRDVHAAKATLIATYYDESAGDVSYADVLTGLDCVSTDIQKARAASRAKGRSLAAAAKRCLARLSAQLSSSGSPARDVAKLGRDLAVIATAIGKGKAFGTKSTALRKASLALVKRHFGDAQDGVDFPEAYADLECVDVKIEAGRISGASACIHRLARLVDTSAPPTPPATFGSDLTGDPVVIAGTYPEDTEFWTDGVTVPADGVITEFRLKTGADPIDLPVRFSIVSPQPDGQVKVLTTTDPPYPLPANSPGVHSFKTSALGFTCCNVTKGDIVTVDNSGAGQTADPYVWFARKAGFTTFSHTCSPCGRSQDPGMVWTGMPHEGFELLLQIVEQPD